MKKLIVITALAFTASSALAQQMPSFGNMDEKQMRKMMENQEAIMQQAAGMQDCFEKAGGDKLMQRMEKEGKEANAKIKALCDAGERDEAQDYAMDFSKKMSKDKEVQALQKCGKHAQEMMSGMPHMTPEMHDETAHDHVCDHMDEMNEE